ncbi:HesA/MoeB/ThiF family protein [uncultured Shewanella sp.]|uniref:HesA/MoeB/ThiF family protein n=1 Tax=uncultured Shewanella sp. TaxID=173975 RepID=UPI002637E3BD|nr:HesA/MoeB/ThiF family protein [uncultured Shewanella sp.]
MNKAAMSKTVMNKTVVNEAGKDKEGISKVNLKQSSSHSSPPKGLSAKDFIRYSRQVLLPEVGEAGQCQLQHSHVIIVGVGGLGHLAAQYLAAAGVGRLTLIDGDKVEVSNLPRQLLFSDSDLGQYKARCAQVKLQRAYVDCDIEAIECYLDEEAVDLPSIRSGLANADLVLDCTDNFTTRHLVNRLCVQSQTPLISASAAHFQGQLLQVDIVRSPSAGCYHCLFPSEMQVSQTCSTVGVLGPMVGVMASMQTLLAVNTLLGIEPSLERSFQLRSSPEPESLSQLWRLNGKTLDWQVAKRQRDPHCPVCATYLWSDLSANPQAPSASLAEDTEGVASHITEPIAENSAKRENHTQSERRSA